LWLDERCRARSTESVITRSFPLRVCIPQGCQNKACCLRRNSERAKKKVGVRAGGCTYGVLTLEVLLRHIPEGPGNARRTGVTRRFRDRAPVHSPLWESHPLVKRLHPRALMPSTILQAEGRGDVYCRYHRGAPARFGGTRCSDRQHFGRAALGTAGWDRVETRGGCHTGCNASWNLPKCLAPCEGARDGAPVRGCLQSSPPALDMKVPQMRGTRYERGHIVCVTWITYKKRGVTVLERGHGGIYRPIIQHYDKKPPAIDSQIPLYLRRVG